MERRESLTRQRIIDIAATMVAESGSDAFRILELAERAGIGVPTIYYHFDSRDQVVAEAQLENYGRLTEPLRQHIHDAVTALARGDEGAFVAALVEDVTQSWSFAEADRMAIMRTLIDIWSDEATRRRFEEMLEGQYARWIALLSDAQERGWIGDAHDAGMLVAIFWAASVGQLVIPHRQGLDVTSATVAEFGLRVIRQGLRADSKA